MLAARLFKVIILPLLIVAFLVSCGKKDSNRLYFEEKGRTVPAFNTDSAYQFLESQVAFGPRNPNSEGHQKTKFYLLEKLKQYAGDKSVFAQEFTYPGYDGDTLKLTNIIAAFNTQSSDRIMLCAHWDTRPRADKDSANVDQPILGADDGASGIAVLLELARLMSNNTPNIGIDLIFFDGEDYGKSGSLDQYFLGSRYWANNPPVKNYKPRFGILLDMVAGVDARFPKEKHSLQFAPALVNEIWSIAGEKKYENIFLDQQGNFISDDHVVINRILNIPTINIIRHKPDSESVEFAPYWHTQNDDLDIISKETLQAVGDVLAELIYNRI